MSTETVNATMNITDTKVTDVKVVKELKTNQQKVWEFIQSNPECNIYFIMKGMGLEHNKVYPSLHTMLKIGTVVKKVQKGKHYDGGLNVFYCAVGPKHMNSKAFNEWKKTTEATGQNMLKSVIKPGVVAGSIQPITSIIRNDKLESLIKELAEVNRK